MGQAEEAALKAGRMLRENQDKCIEVAYKGAIDIVTNFDQRSQELIFQHLSSVYPDHGFIAEEDLCEEKAGGFRWIIDPIDGTTNYAHGIPAYCVSIALERDGEVILGVVFDPSREEMFTAVKGGKAFLNGKRIRVSKAEVLGRSLLATGFPYDIWESDVDNIRHCSRFLKKAQDIRRCGSAALDLCYVACGRYDGFWEMKLKPWDVAAGGLIVESAGGRVSDFSGQQFSIYRPECLASNGLIHSEMIDVLQKGQEEYSRIRE